MVELVESFKDILECKKTDAISNKKKNEAWEEILMKYNARRNGIERTITQLKTVYKNLKGKVRREIAQERLEVFKTGGGSADGKKITHDNPLYSIVARSVTPNKNPFDSSSDLFNDTVYNYCAINEMITAS